MAAESLRMDLSKIAPDAYRHFLQLEGLVTQHVERKLLHLLKLLRECAEQRLSDVNQRPDRLQEAGVIHGSGCWSAADPGPSARKPARDVELEAAPETRKIVMDLLAKRALATELTLTGLDREQLVELIGSETGRHGSDGFLAALADQNGIRSDNRIGGVVIHQKIEGRVAYRKGQFLGRRQNSYLRRLVGLHEGRQFAFPSLSGNAKDQDRAVWCAMDIEGFDLGLTGTRTRA